MIRRQSRRVKTVIEQANLADEFQDPVSPDDSVLVLVVADATLAVGEQVGDENAQTSGAILVDVGKWLGQGRNPFAPFRGGGDRIPGRGPGAPVWGRGRLRT